MALAGHVHQARLHLEIQIPNQQSSHEAPSPSRTESGQEQRRLACAFKEIALRPEMKPVTARLEVRVGEKGGGHCPKVRKVIYIIPALSKPFPIPAQLPVSRPEDHRL